MLSINKILIPSLVLIGSVPSLNIPKNNPKNVTSDSNFLSQRTITEDSNVGDINNEATSNSNYDYNYGISSNSPVGNFKPEPTVEEPLYTHTQVQELVNVLSSEYDKTLNDTVSTYDKYVENTVNTYENHIKTLNNDIDVLGNAYVQAVNLLSDYASLEEVQEETTQTNENEDISSNTTLNESSTNKEISSEELDVLYDEAREYAAKNTENFEPIQGQNNKPVIENTPDSQNLQNNENTTEVNVDVSNETSTDTNVENVPNETSADANVENVPNETSTDANVENVPNETSADANVENVPNETSTDANVENVPNETSTDANVENVPNETSTDANIITNEKINEFKEKVTSESILNLIKDGVNLPGYTEKNSDFLLEKYGFNNASDFKLITSGNSQNDYFELLILNTADIDETSIINSINSRITSILKDLSENNINKEDLVNKVLLINVNDYVVFSFSNISQQILNFLSNI